MNKLFKKAMFITAVSVVIVGACVLVSDSLTAQRGRDKSGISEISKPNNSLTLFRKIKLYSDSVDMVKYHYVMENEYDDTTRESFNGVVYKKRNFNIDSNSVQYTFNDNDRFFSINHKVALAVYSNLKEVKAEALKNKKIDRVADSLNIRFTKLNSIDLSDTLVTYLIAKDRSFENNSKIVIDVDFIDESPMLNYYLVFDKQRQMADSMVIRLVQMEEFDAPNSEMNNDEDLAYYRDLTATESYVTFRAFGFSKGNYNVQKAIDKYIAVAGSKVKLLGYKNYNLTVLK